MLKPKSLPGRARTPSGGSWGVVVLLALLCAPSAQAQDLYLAQQTTDTPAAQVAAQISQRQALELVRARFPGNVISINEVQQEGQPVYRVRLDNNGNVFTVYVNAVTGAVTREQQ